MVYFTVASEGSTAGAIKRAYIPTVDDGSNNMGASIRLDIDYITTPDGIAVDWVGRCVVDTQVSRLARLCSFSPLASGELHHLQITERFFLHRVHIFFFCPTSRCRNLYWADSRLQRLEVALLDGRYRKHLVKTDLGHPSAVALNPRLG